MTRPWSKGRIAFLVLGVICVAAGLFMIIPALGS
ncbi:hypothetical protein HDC95_001196 [Microbacterium sp. AK031]|nr:hypothetical protein [Microbacterium sp. AK031]